MELKNNLYDIMSVSHADGLSLYTIKLNPECVIYKAHFPEMPITPGVCIIELVKELLEDNLNKQLKITGVKNAKFISVLTPNVELVYVSLSKIEADGLNVKSQIVVSDTNNTIYAKISLQTVIA